MRGTDPGPSFRVRPARSEEAGLLSRLALRSKGHWGYDEEFLEACREVLTLSPEAVATLPVFVLEEKERVLGFYGLRELGEGEMELLYLFVEPSEINRGCGKLLWNHALKTASELGARTIFIESDPNAEPFYLAMGAQRVGAVASSIRPGRTLPLLKFHLAKIAETNPAP